jgi:hypothetical protein
MPRLVGRLFILAPSFSSPPFHLLSPILHTHTRIYGIIFIREWRRRGWTQRKMGATKVRVGKQGGGGGVMQE